MTTPPRLPLETILDFFNGATTSRRKLTRGERLFTQGESGNQMYVVVRGRLRVSRNDFGVVGEIGVGEPVGELALIGEARRVANVAAIRDTELLELAPEILSQLKGDGLRWILDILGNRMRLLSMPKCQAAGTLVLWLAEEGNALKEVAATLGNAIRAQGIDTVSVSSADLPTELQSCNDGDCAKGIAEWISDLETRQRFVLLVAHPREEPQWSRICLRHADRILVLFEPEKSEPQNFETLMPRIPEGIPADCHPEIELIAVHDDDPPFPALSRFFKKGLGEIQRVHHVRRGSDKDFARVARHETGNSLALVLSGGGARGFAHIGAIRALEERGMTPDSVGGTSMGAFVGGMAAAGWSTERMSDFMQAKFSNGRLSRYQIPLVSIDSGKGYIGAIRDAFGDERIEDFPIPYFAVSCNLSRGCPAVHTTGPASLWIGASMSVPALAPPLIYKGEVFVDGGILNNLPVDVARAQGAQTVYGIDVGLAPNLDASLNFEGWPTSVDAIKSWTRARQSMLPSLASIMCRVATMSSIYQQEQLRREADLLISIPNCGCGLLDWKRFHEVENIGYRSMHEALDNLEKPHDS